MFEFLGMMNNYEDRKVDRYEKDELMVSTAAVNDSDKPFETAVRHPEYNDGDHIIVELYDTKKVAQAGHNDWVKLMTRKKLPDQLTDVSTCAIAELARAFGGNRVYKKGNIDND